MLKLLKLNSDYDSEKLFVKTNREVKTYSNKKISYGYLHSR